MASPVAGLRDRSLEPDGSQRILQRTATAGMHVDVAGGNERQPQRRCDCGEIGATRRVVSLEQPLDGDPQRLAKARLEPTRFVCIGHPAWQPQRETAGNAVAQIGARQAIATLDGAAPAARDQRRQVAVAFAIGRQQDQPQAVIEAKLAADDQLEAAFFRFDVRPHDAGKRAFIGDRQRRVAFLPGARNQLFRMRGPTQEAEVGNAVQFGVSHVGSTSGEDAVHEPLSAAIAKEPQLASLRIAADEVIAADLAAIPPAAFDALRAGQQAELCGRGIAAERTRPGQ